MNNHKKDAKDAKAKLTDKHFQKSGLRFNEHARFTIIDILTNTNLDKKILGQLWKMWKTMSWNRKQFFCVCGSSEAYHITSKELEKVEV